jgi:hypothetical protein
MLSWGVLGVPEPSSDWRIVQEGWEAMGWDEVRRTVLPDCLGARVTAGDDIDVVEVHAPICGEEWFCWLGLREREGGCGHGDEEKRDEEHAYGSDN